MRIVYDKDQLLETDLADNPLEQFNAWMHDVVSAGTDVIIEPNAMVLSTANADGVISSRSVLLKGIDERGLSFFTNYESRKAQEIAVHAQLTVVFPWYPLHRQVVVSGTATKLSAAESEEYFRVRPHLSQLGALASAQSSPIESREVIEQAMQDLLAKYPENSHVPFPDNWGGYLITVDHIEFWQGRRSRLHDRLRFESTIGHDLSMPNNWKVQRYSP
jgi:pyridoxamine 5'-phosphate oxidase